MITRKGDPCGRPKTLAVALTQNNHLMPRSTTTRSTKPKACDKGRYKLGVRFLNNLDKVFYFWSNANQDTRGVSAFRFRQMVLTKPDWAGKIAWAAIYADGQRIHEFNLDQGWR